jgi:hypothetical protein
MNVLVYTNAISSEIHVAITIEIIQKHLEKKDKVFFLSFEGAKIGCYVHNLKDCKYCKLQKDYIYKKLFNKKITILNLDITNEQYNFPRFRSANELLNFKYEDMPIGEMVMSSLTDVNRQVVNDIEKEEDFVNAHLNIGVDLYNNTEKIIKKNQINKVYVWNGRRTTEGPVIYAANKIDVKFNCYITGGTRESYVLQPTKTIHDLEYNKKRAERFYNEYYCNEKTKSAYIEKSKTFFNYMRYGGDKIFGYPYYIDLFSDKINIEPRKKNKKILSIFTSSYYEFYALGADFRSKNGREINHYKNIIEILNDKIICDNYDLRVRWHPNLSTAGQKELNDIHEIIKKTKHEVIHYSPTHKINSYKLLDESDVVLSFGSTIGIEATYYGKPSILWGRAFYEDTGGIYEINSLDELKKLLTQNLDPKPYQNSLKFAFHEKMKGEFLYKHVYSDKKIRYYFDGKRVYKLNFFEKLIEIIKNILRPFGLIKYGRKALGIIKIILGKNANKSYTPSQW